MFFSRSFLAFVVRFSTWLLSRRYSTNFCPDLVSRYLCHALCFFFIFLITFSSYREWWVFLLPVVFTFFFGINKSFASCRTHREGSRMWQVTCPGIWRAAICSTGRTAAPGRCYALFSYSQGMGNCSHSHRFFVFELTLCLRTDCRDMLCVFAYLSFRRSTSCAWSHPSPPLVKIPVMTLQCYRVPLWPLWWFCHTTVLSDVH